MGTLSWIFVSTANDMRNTAQRLAAEVSKLNKMLLTSQDRERQRLARDIHDGPLQALGVELLAIERTKRRLDAARGFIRSAMLVSLPSPGISWSRPVGSPKDE